MIQNLRFTAYSMSFYTIQRWQRCLCQSTPHRKPSGARLLMMYGLTSRGGHNRYAGLHPATLPDNKKKVPDGGEQLYPDDLPDETKNQNRVSVDDVLRNPPKTPTKFYHFEIFKRSFDFEWIKDFVRQTKSEVVSLKMEWNRDAFTFSVEWNHLTYYLTRRNAAEID